MKNQFLLSIIIPTKNRQKYAIKVVEQILQFGDHRIQIVIQDNSDTRELSELLSVYNGDDRIKYNHTERILSFIDNFNLAVNLSDGEYVCIIGDDDGIVPQILDITEWASKNNIDAIKPDLNVTYFWPDSGALGNKTDNGYMSITKGTAKTRLCRPFNEVVKLLHQGAQQYLSLDMVKLYHGIVKKECLERVRAQTGKYFGGLSPDIYIAVALSLLVDKVIAINVPLTISGICNKSASADSATGRHAGKLEEAPHFRGHDQYEWSELVPRFYSVETIWADSALCAIKDLDRAEMLKEFNVPSLAAYCLKKHPEFKGAIMQHYNSCSQTAGKSTVEIKIAQFKNDASFFIKRVVRRVKRKRSDIAYINGVEDITMCVKALQLRLVDRGFDYKKTIQSLDKLIT